MGHNEGLMVSKWMRFLVQLLPQPFVPRSKKREVWSLGEGNTDLKSSDLRRTNSLVVYFPKGQLPQNGWFIMVSYWFYHSSKNEGSLNTRGLGNFSGSSILTIIRSHYFWEISSDLIETNYSWMKWVENLFDSCLVGIWGNIHIKR